MRNRRILRFCSSVIPLTAVPYRLLTSQAARKFLRIQNDWFTHFLEDRCEIAPSYREGSSALYQAYRNYCTDTNEYVRSTTDFYFAVEKAGFTKLNLSGRKFIKGLRLKADSGDFEDFLQ